MVRINYCRFNMDKETYENIIIVISTTGLLFLLGGLIISLLLAARNRQLKHNAILAETKNNFDKELINTRLEVTENILNEVARDLHDDVGQMLTFAILQLNNIKSQNANDLEANLEEIRESVKSSLESVRSISKSLSSDYLGTFGISESLNKLCDNVIKYGKIPAELHFSNDVVFISKTHELFIYRIIQELVTNTLKYAHASKIVIEVIKIDNQIKIKYADNGTGSSPNQLGNNNPTYGMGLTNIYKRARLINGELSVNFIPGSGMFFEMSFPNV